MKLVYPQIVTGADFLRGINKLNYTAPLLARRGAVAASIVNRSMVGVPSFYKTMQKYGILPVIGLSVMLEIGENQTVLVYVYAENDNGYRNLLKMSSAILTSADETLPLKWFQAYCKDCVMVLSLTDSSWDEMRSVEQVEKIQQHSQREHCFIGIARPFGKAHPDEEAIEMIAKTTETQIVAMYEARYLNEEDAFSYEVATAIRNGETLAQLELEQYEAQYTHIPSKEELAKWFEGREEWLTNSECYLLNCRVQLPKKTFLMPRYPVADNQTAAQLLAEKCRTGLQERIGALPPAYEKRLSYELDVINEMRYADYFLIVEDFMRYAREQHILTGPGRGSSAGSLVAYALFITDVDPLKYQLIFERFLNPERITMPDIDIDFQDTKRMDVVTYVAKKYGKGNVAQIGTFGTLTAKAVARNVGRVFGFTQEEMNYVARLIGNQLGITLQQAFDESTELQTWIQQSDLRKKWFQTALLLEGLPRNASTHAAGIVLAPNSLVEHVPLQKGEEQLYVTQWPMGDVEAQGLLKIDLLGLRNLSLLDRIRKMIQYDQGRYLQFEKIPLDDEKTFQLFRHADLAGIFQFESQGMRETVQLVQPTRFEDIYAINALYRPGPMENIPLFAKRKNKQQAVQYMHPKLMPILKETYGIIIFQEQIIQILVQLAGYSLGEADIVRRAISKKNFDVLNNERAKFVGNASRNELSTAQAEEIFNLIVKFADYGFPKSHAVAYSLISYQLAYLKANEPAYFYAAYLSSLLGNHDKMNEVLSEAKAKGLSFLSPSIRHSQIQYTVEKGAIRIGLRSVKGIPKKFFDRLYEMRKEQLKWTSLFDFATLIGPANFTEKIAEQLIKAGAFDDLGQHRATLLASIPAVLNHAKFSTSDSDEAMFQSFISSVTSPKYTKSEPLSMMQQLEYEKEVLGFYLSEHPVLELKKNMPQTLNAIQEIVKFGRYQKVNTLGLITELKKIRTKKGDAMAFMTIQDETGSISCTLFPRQYELYSKVLEASAFIMLTGKVEIRNDAHQIIIEQLERIMDLD